MARTDLTIVDLGPGDDPAIVSRAFEAVLRPSFTADELPSEEDVAPGDGRVVTVALDDAGEPLAAAVTEIDPAGVSLLSYLAVRPNGRASGAGGALLEHLRVLWTASGCELVLAEVHDPRVHPESDDERPLARLRFYGRHGGQVLGVPWVQPALTPGTRRVPGMLLLVMHHAGGPSGEGEAAIPAAAVVAWAEAYVTHTEGGEASGDPELTSLLALLGTRATIPVLPMSRWSEVPLLAAG